MKKVGRYVILNELGRGAMGVVYKASDPTIDREVALKVLSLSVTTEEGTNSPQEMFMREVRAAGRLAHPSIVTIYDAFDDAVTQNSCIVMELVPGITLEKMLESGQPPSIEQSLDLIRQVAEALDYAHRNKVIHRDLKPANILVTEDGRAKITDFGIAKVLAREGVARTIGIMGTPSYMSPEQVRGGDIDARTDIFSVGIMMFTMLTGQKPFAGNTAAVMFKIVYEEPTPPSGVNAHLTPGHDFMIKKCLAKDRDQRYASVRELLADLDDLQHGRAPRSQAVASASAADSVAAPLAVAPSNEYAPIAVPSTPPNATAKPQAPRMPPPPTPMRQEAQPPRPVVPPPAAHRPFTGKDPTVAVESPVASQPIPQAPAPPLPRPAAMNPPAPPLPRPAQPPAVSPTPPEAAPPFGKTLVMRVPDLSSIPSSSSGETHAPVPSADGPSMGRTMPMRVPDLASVSKGSGSPHQPTPPVAPNPPVIETTRPMQVHDVYAAAPPSFPPTVPTPASAPSPAAPALSRPQHAVRAEPLQEVTPTVQVGEAPAKVNSGKSKMVPVLLAVGSLLLVAIAGGLGYWKLHRSQPAAPPPQQTVETQPISPPTTEQIPIQPPQETPPAVTQPTVAPTPVTPAPESARKPLVRKTKPTTAPHAEPVQPAPQPTPQVVAPQPAPTPAAPTSDDISKAEAAKLAGTPRIVNVTCTFTLKEATFTFTGGGKTLFQELEKGKKKKGGFLGIKGSYEGTFTHTLTVPPGVTQLTIHVQTKDGSNDVSNSIRMPGAGGFIPTLSVQVDNDHLTLAWKGGASGGL